MDAIKKKMQAMQMEKNVAIEKGTSLEQKVTEQKSVNEKVCIGPIGPMSGSASH